MVVVADALKTGAATSIAEDVVILLARASTTALRAAHAALEPYGLRARHYATLRMAAGDQGAAQRDLAGILGLDPSAVVAVIDDLERRRLVRRRPDPEDRRTRLITLTAAGHELLAQTGGIAARVQSEVMAALPETDRTAFVRMLGQLVAAPA